MRLIDADRLCENLLNRWSIADARKEELIRQVMADVVTPIVVSQPTVNQWIPVSERLPEEKSDVLVTISDGFSPFVDTDLWDGSRFFCYGNHRVEAWMPLPEPWGGDSE